MRRTGGGEAESGSGGLLATLALRGLARDQGRVDVLEDDLAADDHAGDVLAGGHLVHHREEHLLHDGAQATSAGAAEDGLVGDRLEGVVTELQLDAVELEQPLVLPDQRVLGLGAAACAD